MNWVYNDFPRFCLVLVRSKWWGRTDFSRFCGIIFDVTSCIFARPRWTINRTITIKSHPHLRRNKLIININNESSSNQNDSPSNHHTKHHWRIKSSGINLKKQQIIQGGSDSPGFQIDRTRTWHWVYPISTWTFEWHNWSWFVLQTGR